MQTHRRYLAIALALILVIVLVAYASAPPPTPASPSVPVGAIPKHLPSNNTTSTSGWGAIVALRLTLACFG